MKICFFSEYYSPKYGGQYASVKGTVDICKLKKLNYSIIHKNSKTYLDKKKLERTLKSCDIVHIFGGWTLFYVNISLLALRLEKKIIVHPMGFYEPLSLSQKRLKKFLAWHAYQKKFLARANIIHCASQREENNLKTLNKNFNTAILPFGIHKNFIIKKIKKTISKKCIYFSRLHKQKGLDILIKAWLSLSNTEWTLDIVGYGDQKKYEKLIKNKKNAKINFLKPVSQESQKKKLFNNYDFLVLPTLNESFGIVILESLARGLPVLTTIATPWSSIQKNNAGWIINYSLIELKLVLNEIFKLKKSEFIKKRKNAIKIANNFSKQKLSDLYFKTYQRLLNS